jgi:hypothetical protein
VAHFLSIFKALPRLLTIDYFYLFVSERPLLSFTTLLKHTSQDAISFAKRSDPECYSVWKVEGELDYDKLVLLDISEKLSLSIQPTRANIGQTMGSLNDGPRGDECPITPKFKQVLGFPLTEKETAWLKFWHESSDGELYLKFEGVLRVAFTRLPHNFLLVQFYRVILDPASMISWLQTERTGFCLWDMYYPQVSGERPTPQTAPMTLIYSSDIGCRFFGVDDPHGMTMEELCPQVYQAPIIEDFVRARRTHKSVKLTQTPVLGTLKTAGPDIARAADILYDCELIPTSESVLLVTVRFHSRLSFRPT